MNPSQASPNLHIRSFSLNDYSDLQELANNLLNEHVRLSVTKSKLARFINDNDQILLVAEINNEVIGVISAGKSSGLSETSRWLELFINASWRRKGIGKLLLQSLMSQCNNNENIQRLTLSVKKSNKPAVALYLKHGFIKKRNFFSLFSPILEMYVLT